MQFTVSSSLLLKQLLTIGGVINRNTTLPILNYFLFELEDNSLLVKASDMETTISTQVDILTQSEGSIAVPASMLLETLKSLPEQPLTFNVNLESLNIELISSLGKYKMIGEPGGDFPIMPEAENEASFSILSKHLKRAISKTLFTVSSDELRPAMSGLLMERTINGLHFVATDGYKLAFYTRSDKRGDTLSCIMPKKALALLAKAMVDLDVDVDVYYNDLHVFFNFGPTKLVSRLVDAKYPNYNAVIPLNQPNEMLVNRVDLLNSLKRIAIYSNKSTYLVILNITKESLSLYTQDLDFSNEAKETLPCTFDGESLEIAFNARYLMDLLSVIDTTEVIFRLSDYKKAAVVVPAEQEIDESILTLIIPSTFNNTGSNS